MQQQAVSNGADSTTVSNSSSTSADGSTQVVTHDSDGIHTQVTSHGPDGTHTQVTEDGKMVCTCRGSGSSSSSLTSDDDGPDVSMSMDFPDSTATSSESSPTHTRHDRRGFASTPRGWSYVTATPTPAAYTPFGTLMYRDDALQMSGMSMDPGGMSMGPIPSASPSPSLKKGPNIAEKPKAKQEDKSKPHKAGVKVSSTSGAGGKCSCMTVDEKDKGKHRRGFVRVFRSLNELE